MAELIRVTFPNGEQICYKSPVNTVIKVLAKIGEARFPEITLENAKHPLVSQTIYPDVKKYTKEIVPGWYYINRTDTREKTAQLININKLLKLGLKIEQGDFKANTNPHIADLSRPKNRLQVTMPDGKLIDYESYKDVFYSVIDILGPRRVSAQANFDLSKNQSLLSATNVDGNRTQIDEALYLAYPQTAKKAADMLKLIAMRLRMPDLKPEIIRTRKKQS